MTEPTRRTFRFADGDLSYLEWEGPSGAPLLVFAHASGFNAPTYRFLLAPLAAQFRVVAPDQRAHGLTTLAADPRWAKWSFYRDDLRALIAKLGVRPAVLAGHSMGATASLMAAAAEPDITAALVLCEPVMQPDSAALYALFARAIGREDRLLVRVGPARRRRSKFASREEALAAYRGRGAFRSWQDSMVADYVEGGVVPDPAGGFRLACAPDWEANMFARFPFGLARLGSRVTAPVTILAGTEQSATPQEVVGEFARRQGRTRIIRIEGTSHFLPMEAPERVRAEILRAAGFPVPAGSSSPAVE